MNKLFRNLLALTLAFLMLALCSGCQTAVVKPRPFNANFEILSVDKEIVAENESFILAWESEYKRILLKDKSNGHVWSTTPSSALTPRYDTSGNRIIVNPRVNSPIVIEYSDFESQELIDATAYVASIKENSVSEEITDSGIRVTYYFPDAQISVPVEYGLRNNGININIDIGDITEGDYKLCGISLAPFMCSIENAEENGYLFVPSGSGALIYKKNETDIPITYTQEVYGADKARHLEYEEKATSEKEIRLPVFGSKSGDSALCAIIEDGAESASINVSAGAANIGYSGVYASFSVRGYQWVKIKNKYQRLYCESPATGKFSVTYSPLYGEKANYIGMADTYRSYLKKKYGLTECKDENMLSLEIIGGTNIRTTFLGIPYNKFLPVTTVKKAEEIIKDVQNLTGQKPSVKLFGYGQSGTDIGKTGGGFSVNRSLGSKDDMRNLTRFCKDNDIELFTDFDLVRFNRSGGGVALTDKAVTVNGQTVNCYDYGIWSGTRNYNLDKYFLVSRSKLTGFTEKLEKAADKYGLVGVSLDTLSNYCYSDYSFASFFVKGKMANDVSSVYKALKNSGIGIASSDANDYAAAYASRIFDAPLQSSAYNLFDEDVPFYEIVFKGYVPLSSGPLNLASNDRERLLRAIEGGCGLDYVISGEFDMRLVTAPTPNFYGSDYSDIKSSIEKTVSENSEFYENVKGAKITAHSIMGDGLRKTTFDNGRIVYVNYSQQAITVENTVIGAMSYKLLKGE